MILRHLAIQAFEEIEAVLHFLPQLFRLNIVFAFASDILLLFRRMKLRVVNRNVDFRFDNKRHLLGDLDLGAHFLEGASFACLWLLVANCFK